MEQNLPDGLSQNNIDGGRRPSNLLLLILAVMLGAGLGGMLGGQPDKVSRQDSSEAILSVRAPRILRNGVFFETVVEIRPKRPVENLTIAVSDSLWHEMTINTTLPSAENEEYRDGSRRFSFGKVAAGETFRFKVDGQINPPLFAGTRGEIAGFDGEQRLATVPVRMTVLP